MEVVDPEGNVAILRRCRHADPGAPPVGLKVETYSAAGCPQRPAGAADPLCLHAGR